MIAVGACPPGLNRNNCDFGESCAWPDCRAQGEERPVGMAEAYAELRRQAQVVRAEEVGRIQGIIIGLTSTKAAEALYDAGYRKIR